MASQGLPRSHGLQAGPEPRVFRRLADGPAARAELREVTGLGQHAIEVLMDGLEGLGFVRRRDGRYRMAGRMRKWLAGDRRAATCAVLDFAGDVAKRFATLPDTLRQGGPADFHAVPISPDGWAKYLAFLQAYGTGAEARVVRWTKAPASARRMLDLAGGPARYAVAFARAHPELRVEILDLPPAIEGAERAVAKAGLADRISLRAGDLFETDWGDGHDLILVSHILHCLPEERCRDLLGRARQAIAPGGKLIVQDVNFPAGPVGFGPGFTSLLYFAMMGTRSWPNTAITRWIEGAGFRVARASETERGLLIDAEPAAS